MNLLKPTILAATLAAASLLFTGAHHEASSEETMDSGPVQHYLAIQEALAADDLAAAQEAAGLMVKADDKDSPFNEPLKAIRGATSLDEARAPFASLSKAIVAHAEKHPDQSGTALFVAHCPMAFGNQGASWVQRGKTINNPYFGSRMRRCGMVRQPLGGGEGHQGKANGMDMDHGHGGMNHDSHGHD